MSDSPSPELKDDPAPEEAFWTAAGGFDDGAAEQHASKIQALWELGGDFAAMKPADAPAEAPPEAAAEENVWAAAEPPAGATDPEVPKVEAAPAQAPVVKAAPEPVRPRRHTPEPRSVDEPITLPTSNSTKVFIAAGAGMGVLLVASAIYVLATGGSSDEHPVASVPPSHPAASAQPPLPMPPAPPVAAPTPPAPEGPAEAAQPPVEEVAAPPEPTTATLAVSTTPADAHLTLDGHAVANPYSGELDIDSAHHLEASAPGHDAAQMDVTVARDQAPIVLTLPETPPEQPTTVELAVTTVPANARLEVDGHRVSNPYHATVDIGTAHHLEASAAGHQNAQLDVTVAAEQAPLVLTLTENAGPATTAFAITTVPANAHLEVDGHRVSNPYRETVEVGSAHHLEASAPRHQNAQMDVTIAQGQAPIVLTLPENAPPPPPRVTTATLAISTVPANARLEVDGHRVSNPYRATVDIDSRHRLEASAPGHHDARQEVRVTRDQAPLVLTLEANAPPPAAHVRPHPAHPARPSHPARPAHPAHPAHPANNGRGGGFSSDNPY